MSQPQYSSYGIGDRNGGRSALLPAAILNLQITPTKIEPGESAVVSFTILNQSEFVDSFWVWLVGVPSGWVQQVQPLEQEIPLYPGREQAVQFMITPPRLAESRAGEYPLTIQVVSHKFPNLVTSETRRLTVSPFYELGCVLHSLQPSGVVQGNYKVEIQNDGNTDLKDIKLAVRGAEEWCHFYLARQIDVAAGQRRFAELLVEGREWLPAETKTHNFVVIATHAASRQEKVTEGTWQQIPPNFELNLLPRRRESVGQGRFTVEISNQSEVNLTLTFAGEDDEQGCHYLFKPKEVTVPAGSQKEVALIVRPTMPLRRRDPKSYLFTVTAWPVDAPDVIIQAKAEWMQLPSAFKLLPVGRLLLILLILTLLVIWLYYALIYRPPTPVVQSFFVTPSVVVAGENHEVQLVWLVEVTNTSRIRDKIASWFADDPPSVQISSNNPRLSPLSDLPLEGTLTVIINDTTTIKLTGFNDSVKANELRKVTANTPTPTHTPTPTSTPSPTSTPTPLPTPTSTPIPAVTANKDLTIRNGPGEDFEPIGILSSGQSVDLRGRNPENTWWQVNTPNGRIGWIPADPASTTAINLANVSVVVGPTPTPTQTATPTPTATPKSFYYFEARLVELKNDENVVVKCVELNWYAEHVDRVYITGLVDRDHFLPKEDNPTLFQVIGHGGHQDCYDVGDEVEDLNEYTLYIYRKDGQICSMQREFNEDEGLFRENDTNCETD